jgi:CRISPR-associated endonuclease/helicase Cas3
VEGASRSFAGEEDSPETNAQLAKTRLGDRITLVPVYHVDGALALDPGGTWQLSKDALPTPDQQRDVLAAAVPVSDRRLIAAYRDEHRPPELRWPWPERGLPALLRGLHPLPLDKTHTARVGGRILRLDPDLGLLIDQEEL